MVVKAVTTSESMYGWPAHLELLLKVVKAVTTSQSMYGLPEIIVVILCLPPHTSANSQPLDAGVFRSLKYHSSEVCHKWIDQHPGCIIMKLQFSELLKKAWMQAMTPANAIAGFRKAGIYTFNLAAIDVPFLDPAPTGNEDNDTILEEKVASSDDGAMPFTLNTPVETSSMQAAFITPLVMNPTFTMKQVAQYE